MDQIVARISGNLKRTLALGLIGTVVVGWSAVEPAASAAPTATTARAGSTASTVAETAVDRTFSIAIMPDTQMEVLSGSDKRFRQRTNWLVRKQESLDLRYVIHTGDVVNWDTDDHRQYVMAQQALAPLNTAEIPYSLSIGNHDTEATGPGGSARDSTRTHELQRDTTTFNTYFDTQDLDLAGAYEAGKVDNTYHTFSAGGRSWLVLNLELWPRKSVVAWAATVVKSHPNHNVIVATHAYLTGKAKISRSDGGYGDTSPYYLYTHVIKKYANVRMVFSGHVGKAGHRVDHGVHGNRIDSFLTTMHSKSTNPVRLVTINTASGRLTSRVYAPWTKKSYSAYKVTARKIRWVR